MGDAIGVTGAGSGSGDPGSGDPGSGDPGSVAVIAHRGASAAAPENTLAAFDLARRMGADAVELDVRRTRDGVLVVHHNPGLADGRLIRDTDAADLPATVPDLGAALDACAGMWVNVEIKNDPREPDFDPTDAIAEQTAALLVTRDEHHRWLVSAFRLETVDRCRAAAADAGAAIRTAWLTAVVPDDVVDVLVSRGHVALHPWVQLLGRDTVDACREAGLDVNVWTCDDPGRMAELIEWGVSGLCTNLPDLALSVRAGSAATG